MKIVIGNDHAGPKLKNQLIEYMESLGHEVDDFGIGIGEKIDYPIMGEKVGRAVAEGKYDCGVLICGTGVGISIAANKVPGVRAAVCSDVTTARLAKEHNGANIIAFGERIVGIETAKDIVNAYLSAVTEDGRHADRRAMFAKIEEKYGAKL
ncbi:MAG: ribose 5-phosphate isomerase B [Lachnospiraceae bacterium]|nr:ribose 5-phosphate isomerase B [Lachnospiraceae bacterium]